MHKINLGIRDLHDDNVLILRKPDGKFSVRLCDFGYVANLGSGQQSVNVLSSSQFRNPTITGKKFNKQEF